MNLEKSFRALVSPAYEPTEPIAVTDEEAVDLAQLNTDLQSGLDVFPILDEDEWPSIVTLRVRLVPVPFSEHQRQITATFCSNDTLFAATIFYDPSHQEGQLLNNCYAGIDLVYAGTGDDQIKTGQLLYRKQFPTQQSALMCQQQHLGAGEWAMSTHLHKQMKVNEIPIFAYGGVYQPHLPLDLAMPVYATLAGTNEHKTRVTLKSQKFWHDKGVYESKSLKIDETTYTFHDASSEEARMNLGAAITGGCVKVNLERQVYKSCSWIQVDAGIVDITFQEEETCQ